MNHTFILSKDNSDELVKRCARLKKSEFIRQAVEEKLDRERALDHMLVAEDEIIERMKLRLEQACAASIDEINTAMLASVQTLNAMRENSGQMADEVDELRHQCHVLSTEAQEARATMDHGINVIGAILRDLNGIASQLTGVSYLKAPESEQEDSEASGNSEVVIFTSAPKRG